MFGRDEPFAMLGVPCTLPSLEDRAIKLIRRNYQISDSVTLRLPKPDEWACSLSGVEVYFYEGAFQAGLRFPIPYLVKEFLDYSNISSSQLATNVWRTIISMMIVWYDSSKREDSLSLEELLYYYRLYQGKYTGYFYLAPRDARRSVIAELPSSSQV